MQSLFRLALCAALLLTVTWLGAGVAAAQQAERQRIEVDLPAQPLDRAVIELARQAGLAVGGNAALLRGKQAPALEGEFTPREGLDRLLAGSGVAARFSDDDTVTLVTAAEPPDQGPMRLGPVTVTASRVERSVSTIPGSVTIIDSQELDQQRLLTRDIQSVLQQTVPGFRGATGTRGEGQNALRGRTALILLNGVPQSVQLRTSGLGINNIDLRMIDRIEVARTANATLGFGGSGGTINLITRRPDSPVPLYTLEVGTAFQPHELDGGNLTREGYASIEGRHGSFDYLVGLSGRNTGEQFDADGDRIPDGFTEARSEEYAVAGSLGWQLDTERSLRLDWSYRRLQDDDFRTRQANAIVGERKAEAVPNTDPFSNPFFDPLTASNISLVFDDANVMGSTLKIQTFYQHQEINQSIDFTEFGSCCILSRGDETRIDRRVGGRLSIETPLPNGASVVWGSDIVRNFNSELTASEIAGQDVGFRPDITQDNYAGFAQFDIPIGSFLLTGGVRHDRFDVDLDDVLKDDGTQFEGGNIDVDATLFNAGLVHYLTDELELFASFSQGLDITQAGRAASSVESAAQVRLEPATTDAFEIGTRYFGPRWDGSLAVFYTDSELSSRTINPGGELQLAIPLRQPERVWGAESTLNYQFNERWRVGGMAAYQEGERKVDGEWLDLQGTFIHPFRLTGHAEYNHRQWLTARLQFEYSPGSDRFPGSTAFGEGEISDLFLMDLIATARTDHGEFRLGLENLLNRDYITQFNEATNVANNYFTQPGITARLTWRIQF